MKVRMMTAATVVCVAGLMLAGCNQQQASKEPAKSAEPAGQAAAPAGQAGLCVQSLG